jgi:2-methylcitrate dehydratase PrpD
MIKTRTELLGEIYNSVHEEILRMEIAIETLADIDDEAVIETVVKRSPLGAREENLTKKDVIAKYIQDIEKREKVLVIIERLLKQNEK